MQSLVKSGFSLDSNSESPLNLNWISEFPCFLYRGLVAEVLKKERKKKGGINVSYNIVYKE